MEMAEHGLLSLTPFLVLGAFSSGCTALTGIEAISNGVTAFKLPSSRNAAITLLWMSGILATMFLGITLLAHQINAVPSHTRLLSRKSAEPFTVQKACSRSPFWVRRH